MTLVSGMVHEARHNDEECHMKIGLIGAGLMGHGMGANILAGGHELHVVAHRNRAPVENLVSKGAIEALSPQTLAMAADIIVMCVTGTHVAQILIEELKPALKRGTVIIDTTTNKAGGPEAFETMLKAIGVTYIEAPLTGGAAQAEQGVLGAIVGCDGDIPDQVHDVLSCFCSRVERFGPVGAAARAKLVSNFLALGTAALAIETFKKAQALDVDWKQLYDLALLGSGKSVGLERIIGNALAGDFEGYKFTVSNSLKDLTYFDELAKKNSCDSSLLSALIEVFSNAASAGHETRMISELLDPDLSNKR